MPESEIRILRIEFHSPTKMVVVYREEESACEVHLNVILNPQISSLRGLEQHLSDLLAETFLDWSRAARTLRLGLEERTDHSTDT